MKAAPLALNRNSLARERRPIYAQDTQTSLNVLTNNRPPLTSTESAGKFHWRATPSEKTLNRCEFYER